LQAEEPGAMSAVTSEFSIRQRSSCSEVVERTALPEALAGGVDHLPANHHG
jgi:hypothetical protein